MSFPAGRPGRQHHNAAFFWQIEPFSLADDPLLGHTGGIKHNRIDAAMNHRHIIF